MSHALSAGGPRLARGLGKVALCVPLALAACGPPVLYDTELVAVRNPLVTASVDNGWVAVDSTDRGLRAVLELRIEASSLSSQYVSLHVPQLHCSSSGSHRPIKVRREVPVCTTPPRAAACPADARDGGCPEMLDAKHESCIYVVRAEYLLGDMPHLDESHFFTFAQTESALTFSRER